MKLINWIWVGIKQLAYMPPQQMWNASLMAALVVSLYFNVTHGKSDAELRSQISDAKQEGSRQVIEMYSKREEENKKKLDDMQDILDRMVERKKMLDSSNVALDKTYESLKK